MVQSAGDHRRIAAARVLPGGLFLWGVVCASCLWFLSLTTISSLFKNRFTPRLLRIINLVCGLVIFFYGVKLGWSFVELWQSAF